jgi:IS1 transposase
MVRKWEGTLRACARRTTKGGEPDAVKAASPVRRGGMGRRTERQRALSLPDWGAYTRHLDPDEHCPGKRNTQKIERKHLTLQTRMKRLARKTICFSKTTQMHDIVLGLFVNRYAFGRAV